MLVNSLKSFSDFIEDLSERVSKLEALLAGVQRTTSVDNIPGFYFPGRVGIMTQWYNTQPAGKGCALSVATGVDNIAVLIQHDGAEGTDGLGKDSPTERTALKILNTDPNPTGHNTGIAIVASNAPHGNVAINAAAQYSPEADEKLTIIKQEEWKNE